MLDSSLAFKLMRRNTNRFLSLHTGKIRPAFYDIDRTFPALRRVDESYDAIRTEALALLDERVTMPAYHEVDPTQRGISAESDPSKRWSVLYLYSFGAKPELNRARCPVTAAVVDQVPHLLQSFFSILSPGKSIRAHKAPYWGCLRYHLALKVPKSNPPSIRVGDQYYTWREGESLLFDDSLEHEVYNESNADRIVLIVDVMRPMPMAFHAANWVFVNTMGRRYGRDVTRTN